MTSRNQRGEGKLGCVLGLVVLVVAVIVAIKAIPVMLNVHELADFATRQAERAALPGATDTAIREAILDRAQSLKLPLSRENLKVNRRTTDITVSYQFVVEINLPFYTYRWDVQREINRPLIFT